MKTKLITLFLLLALLVAVHVLSFVLWKPKPHELSFRAVTFEQLPGWDKASPKKSLSAFQISCKAFLRQDPEKFVGSQFVDMQAKDWHPVCQDAMARKPETNVDAKAFFQKWFTPVEFFDNKPVTGLFTGYYMSALKGSLTRTKEFNVPIYGLPNNLIVVNLEKFDPNLKNRRIVGRLKGHRIVPFYTREAINRGAIEKSAPVIAWVNNSVDRSFLEIQGSGIIELTDGSQLIVGYAGQNGAPYTPIARVLIEKGVMTKDNASMQHIRRYLEEHPNQLNPVLNKNKSFVFFDKLKEKVALGSQGVALTPGYSLAVDLKWIPIGVPLWLNTTRPEHNTDNQRTFRRLMIAQDTGGAIRGVVRGDVYWGAGERATEIAGKMKNPGHYWLLLPNQAVARLKNKIIEQ